MEGATFIGKNALVMLSACSKLQHSKLVTYGLDSLSMVHQVTKQICVFEYIFLKRKDIIVKETVTKLTLFEYIDSLTSVIQWSRVRYLL